MPSSAARLAVGLGVAWPAVALAHAGPGELPDIADDTAWDIATAALLGVAALGYIVGVERLLARGRTLSIARAACYGAGLGCLALALLSPLDRASEIRFSAHMGQHELLVLFAAPLVVAGRPERILRAALPAGGRDALAALVHRRRLRGAIAVLGNRWLAVALHAVVVWVWHIPVLFEAALQHEAVHALQHISFFATAALFWWAMVRGRYGQLGYGVAVVFVFVTALHKGLLAMLFTVAGRTFYPTHVARTAAAGGDPLEDQTLAGVLMWVPAGVIMAALALGLFVAWLGALERRDETR